MQANLHQEETTKQGAIWHKWERQTNKSDAMHWKWLHNGKCPGARIGPEKKQKQKKRHCTLDEFALLDTKSPLSQKSERERHHS